MTIGPQTLQGGVGNPLDMLGLAIGPAAAPPVSRSMSKPNFVAITTLSRIGWSASPTSSSFTNGPYASAVSKVRHAKVMGGTDQLDHLALVGSAGHRPSSCSCSQGREQRLRDHSFQVRLFHMFLPTYRRIVCTLRYSIASSRGLIRFSDQSSSAHHRNSGHLAPRSSQ